MKKIIVGNWKMNPTTAEEAKFLFSKIKRASARLKGVLPIICPPEIHLLALSKLAERSSVRLGVQDVFWEDQGFYTGQVSPKMAYDAGARYAIVGHSEKRRLGETDEQTAKKTAAAVADKLVVILCVGEIERDSEGRYFAFLENQIISSLKGIKPGDLKNNIVIAYEPVWEIGKKDMSAMKPSDIHEASIFIKKVLNDHYGASVAEAVPILYGGSVSAKSARECVIEGAVDGLLVGRQSLDSDAFIAILKSVDGAK